MSPSPPANSSLSDWLASQSVEERSRFISSLSEEQAAALLYEWPFWARSAQLPPCGDWKVWFVKAGRGFGKTRSGAELVRAKVESGQARAIALVAKNPKDARDVMIGDVHGAESGLLQVCPPWIRPRYEPSKARLTWPNGATATIFSAEDPDALRGPQHDFGWCDELAKWKYPRDAWDNLMFGLRLGANPQVVVTTTPTPTDIVREILAEPTTVVTGGSTYENLGNLAPSFISYVLGKYEGTRLGQQELHGDVLTEAQGALWTRQQVERLRVRASPALRRIVVAVDPAVSSKPGQSDECGIVSAGLGEDSHAYVLEDVSDVLTPDGWASRAVNLFKSQKADRIVGEVNNGGEMVEYTVRTVNATVPFKAVHASRGKRARAEPVSALYEQGKVHHVGYFADLESQMCTWVPKDGGSSPDRLDALVWALTELMLSNMVEVRIW